MFLLYIFAGILRLQCTAHAILFAMTNISYFTIRTSRKHVTVPITVVFCSSLYVLYSYAVQIFSEWLSDGSNCPRYYSLYNFYFDIRHTLSFIVRCLYIKISPSFFITFLSPEISMSINRKVPFSITRITITRILLGIVISFFIPWLHNMAALISWPASNDFRKSSYQCSFSNFVRPSLQKLKCSWAHALSRHLVYFSFASNGHADITCCVALYCCHSPHLLSVSVFNIYVARNLVLNAWFVLLIFHYYFLPCIISFFLFFIKEFPNLAFVRFVFNICHT